VFSARRPTTTVDGLDVLAANLASVGIERREGERGSCGGGGGVANKCHLFSLRPSAERDKKRDSVRRNCARPMTSCGSSLSARRRQEMRRQSRARWPRDNWTAARTRQLGPLVSRLLLFAERSLLLFVFGGIECQSGGRPHRLEAKRDSSRR
jgi:hypothetical protein